MGIAPAYQILNSHILAENAHPVLMGLRRVSKGIRVPVATLAETGEAVLFQKLNITHDDSAVNPKVIVIIGD